MHTRFQRRFIGGRKTPKLDVYAEAEQVARLSISKGVVPKHFRTLAQLTEFKDPKRLEVAIKYQTREKGPRGWTYEFADQLLKKLATCEGDTVAFKKIMLNAIMLHPYLQYHVQVERILDLQQPILRIAQQTCKPHHVTDVKVITKEDDIFLIIEIPEFRGSLGDKRGLSTRIFNEIRREIPQLQSIRFRVEIA